MEKQFISLEMNGFQTHLDWKYDKTIGPLCVSRLVEVPTMGAITLDAIHPIAICTNCGCLSTFKTKNLKN
jgi:hypothetical protein